MKKVSKAHMDETMKQAHEAHDRLAYSLFTEVLPYYWDDINNVPAHIKLKLAINGFSSILNACQVLCGDIYDRKLKMQLDSMLRHVQVWHEMPSIMSLETASKKKKNNKDIRNA